jgi:hypothetical protein
LKFSRLLSVSLAAVGSTAAARVLKRRQRWEATNNRVAICIDHDDARVAAIRAGLPFNAMLARLAEHGATHVSLPELTLNRLRASGQLTPQAPAHPLTPAPPVGHWNYLHGSGEVVAALAKELAARLPYTQAQVVDKTTLAFAGDLQTLGEIGLGFDGAAADQITRLGLASVPRPVSYAWPEPVLIERTLAQATEFGRIVAFAGDMILGHEMHLRETLTALRRHDLVLAYFAHSRHQKGDWFLAKQRTPHVVLAHRFSPAEMRTLDFHAACHNWVHLAREHGIRLCYVNFFRELHATEPLDSLHYIAHLRQALEDAGYHISVAVEPPTPIPTPGPSDVALSGVATAGLASAAAERWLGLPDVLAAPLAIAMASGAAALPYLERASLDTVVGDHDDGNADDKSQTRLGFTTSYAPKLLALATAALTPVAGLSPVGTGTTSGTRYPILGHLFYEAAGAVTLAALASGEEYQLRIEDYRGFNLDWLVPMAATVSRMHDQRMRIAALAGLAGLWIAAYTQRLDLLARIDPAHAEGHTHHVSRAQQLIGDVVLTLGPRPARKWAGLGPFGHAAAIAWARRGYRDLGAVADLVGTVGDVLALAPLRHPERPLSTTAQLWLPSYVTGAALGLLLLLIVRATSEK